MEIALPAPAFAAGQKDGANPMQPVQKDATTPEQIAEWREKDRRYQRFGRRVPRTLRIRPRPKRWAQKVGIPLRPPPKQNSLIRGTHITT